ncbi:MAG: hypothetical protein UT50_C0015G0001, partial [Candidatus Moranbacteria bacterium GW2011_GWA2_39_41]
FLIFDRLIVRILGFLFEKSKGLIIRFLNEVSRTVNTLDFMLIYNTFQSGQSPSMLAFDGVI